MNATKKTLRWMFLLVLLLLVLAGCTQELNTEDPDIYTPECTAQELILAINDANADGVPSEIQLPANCVYTLTHVDNTRSMQPYYPDLHNGLPEIRSDITIRGNNAVIDIQPASGQNHFGHFFVDRGKKLKLYDLTLSNGVRPVGGIIFNNSGDLFVYNTRFLNNFAYQDSSDTGGKGGAIFTYSGKLRVLANSLFQGNLVGESFSSTANLGGAIYSMDSYLAIYNSTFLENYAAGHGGAVYAVETPFGEMAFGGLITIQNTNFSENWALGDGGALYLKGEIEGIYAVTTSFADNIAEGQGGAIFSEDSDLSTSFSQLTNNQAENGGAVYSRRTAEGETSRFVSDHSVFSSNTAAGNGGAIFSENSDVEIEDGDISANQAASCGGLQLGGSPGLDVAAGDLGAAPLI